MTVSPRLYCLSTIFVILWSSPQASHSDGKVAKQDLSWTELMASMDRMHAAMASVKPSGTSDVDFVRLMLPHHQAAVEMARTELLDGHNPQMRRLAGENAATDQEIRDSADAAWLTQHSGKDP